MTDWDKWMKEYREHKRQLQELAGSLEPSMVGDLYFVDRNGEQRTPGALYFAAGVNGCVPGEAFCHFDNALCPVYLSRNGARLVVPEWAELCAKFKDGFVRDFYVE